MWAGLKLQQQIKSCSPNMSWDVFLFAFTSQWHLSVFPSLSPTEAFLPSRCSYSSRASRCWCALDYNEDELRTVHLAYLCVTSMAGNATSNLLDFTPLGISKCVCVRASDSNVSVGFSGRAGMKCTTMFLQLPRKDKPTRLKRGYFVFFVLLLAATVGEGETRCSGV